MNVQFLEMRDSGLDHVDVSEPNGCIVHERHPEMAVTLRVVVIFLARRLSESGLRRVADKEHRSGELDGRQQRNVLRPRRGYLVFRCRRSGGRRAEVLIDHRIRKARNLSQSSMSSVGTICGRCDYTGDHGPCR